MAVAEPATPELKRASRGNASPLWLASLIAGVLVLAGLVSVVYGIPMLLDAVAGRGKTGALTPFVRAAIEVLFQLVAVIVLGILGTKLGGGEGRPGIRGGIFVAISLLFTVFFLARAVAMIAQRVFTFADPVALGVFLGAIAGFAILTYKLFGSGRFDSWAKGVEDAGLFSSSLYKKNLGLRVRRLTILGILLIFGSGVYTLMENGWLEVNNPGTNTNNWIIHTPFLADFILLPDIRFTVPLLLLGLGLWLAWRAINMPMFADFLIATEAEMNKVSWPTRKQLIRDTIVVLVTLAIFTLFFFLVDVFWSWLLSRDLIDILPHADVKQLPGLDDAPIKP